VLQADEPSMLRMCGEMECGHVRWNAGAEELRLTAMRLKCNTRPPWSDWTRAAIDRNAANTN